MALDIIIYFVLQRCRHVQFIFRSVTAWCTVYTSTQLHGYTSIVIIHSLLAVGHILDLNLNSWTNRIYIIVELFLWSSNMNY